MRTTGRLKNKNIILLPKEWKGKINTESIVVQLTPYGVGQDLFVKTIDFDGTLPMPLHNGHSSVIALSKLSFILSLVQHNH